MMKSAYLLYAEDDEDEIEILKDAFFRLHCPVVVRSVQNGFEVLQYLERVSRNESYPSLILLDKRMPRLDGLETLRFLKSDDIYRLIPTALFTSSFSDSEMQLCKQLGAESFIKPQNYKNWHQFIDTMNLYLD